MPKSKSKGKGKPKSKKEEKKEPEKESLADKHPGYSCLYLGDKELQGYGFKTGEGLLDVAPFKTLKKEEIIEEIRFKGKMCAFQPFLSVVEKYENEDILFIWDPDEEKQSDCNFYFCGTIDTFEIEKKRLGISDDGLAMDPEEMAKKKEEEEQERKRKEAEEEKKREDERIALAIKELKKPMIAREWKDLGSFEEIMNNKLKAKERKFSICLSRKRREFGQTIEFSDQGNVEGMNTEIKSLQSGYDAYVYRQLTDKNIQIGGERVTQCTQTQWNRKINKIVQYECNEESMKKKKRKDLVSSEIQTQTQTSDDMMGFDDDTKTKEVTNDNNDNANGAEDREDDDEEEMNDKLEQFLEDISEDVQRMLSDNDLVNIFEDDFKLFTDGDKDLGLDTKTENIKEIQTFVDLNWSRGKKISHIEWMSASNKVAVSCIENMGFDDRVNIMNKSRISSILLWNLSHILLKAQTILTAPSDIFTFKLHPQNENIIIGGLETGQVVLWDLNDFYVRKSKESNVSGTGTGTTQQEIMNGSGETALHKNDDFAEDEEEKIPQIEPKMLSYIEKSHTKCVGDILWLPQDVMMTSSGELAYLDLSNRPKGPYKQMHEEQFMSISGDGTILFWEIQAPKQTEKEKKKNENAKWIPIYSKKVAKTSLNESMFVDKEAMDLAKYDETKKEEADDQVDPDDDNETNDKSADTIFGCKMCYTPLLGKICIGTELGEFCMFNYSKINKEFVTERPSLLLHPNGDSNKSSCWYLLCDKDETEKKEESNNNNKQQQNEVLQNSMLCISNTIAGEHFLDIKSVCISPHFSDIYLTIGDWRFCIWRNNKLIFISPYCSSYICCGCWSPTRPAVIITAKYDGTLDIWDLLDQTHGAVYNNSPISSTAITSIVFSPQSVYHNELAVGDSNGNLRILQIPRNFAIPLNNEKLLMAQFYEKECVRINFINKRSQVHKKRKLEMDRCEKEKEKEKENEEKQESANKNNNDNNINVTNQKEIQIQIEKKYQKMFVAFKKQIGIKA